MAACGAISFDFHEGADMTMHRRDACAAIAVTALAPMSRAQANWPRQSIRLSCR
jgi:hypothetical protein